MTSIAAASSGIASSSSSSSTSSINITPLSSSSSSSFNEENLMRKLDNCTPTQEGIQTLGLWIIHHKNHHDIITKLWLKKMSDSSVNSKQKLALFYLANDVIQNCKRKNAKIYQESFKSVLNQAVSHCRSDSIREKVERVFDVWLERQVFDKEFVQKLTLTLNYKSQLLTRSPETTTSTTTTKEEIKPVKNTNTNNESIEIAKDEIEKIITEFQPKNLCESINEFEGQVKQSSVLKSEIEATRLLEINLEHVKQYRDRTQCAKFKIEFESSCEKLEDYVRKLNEQYEQRKHLIKLMQQSEIFYDAQYKDAKTVFSAYRSYGSKVHAVKKKLDELIETKFSNSNKNLDNLDMEMSDDDQNSSILNSSSQQSTISNLLQNSSLNNKSHSSTRANILDPRQNRQISKKDENNKKRERSSTPVRDEKPDNPANNSPLDFLTKFINKSSNQTDSPPTTTTTNTQPSSNLSFLVNSLQKFVNNGNSGYTQSSEFYNPSGINYQSSYMGQESNRPGTPTKDEVYQPPILIPQPQPQSYNQMIVPGHPPPPPPYQMFIPPPPMGVPGQLMIDPYQHMPYHPPPPPGFYPSPVPQNVPPPPQQQISPLMSVQQQQQPPPVKSPKSNWNERKNESPLKVENNFPVQKKPLLSTPIISPNNNLNKRKFSSFDDDRHSQGNNTQFNRFKPFQQQQQQQHNGNNSHFHHNQHHQNNRIPTINSQRDRGESLSGSGHNTNNYNNTHHHHQNKNNRNRFY